MKAAFTATRRAYRAACRVSLLHPGSIETRIAARDALRALTGHWDDCSPATLGGLRTMRRTSTNDYVHSWTVYAACTRFLKTH